MPRKKRETVDAMEPAAVPAESTPATSPSARDSEHGATDTSERREETDNALPFRTRTRSYRATVSLPGKGVTLGERNGHDWVISFPEDPGKQVTEKLRNAGFDYRDRKWKLFTHAANRPAVEALAKELKRQAGDDVSINDYPVRQVVLAFETAPGDEVTTRLKEADFHFRPDMTWNADHNAENQKFARDFIQSLPDIGRSAAAGR